MSKTLTFTKYNHSCLLMQESGGRAVLFDPGEYSLEFKDSLLETVDKIDDLVITHEHPDHFSVDFVKAILAKFPTVNITCTLPVASKLAEFGAPHAQTEANGQIALFTAPHENLSFGNEGPANLGIHYQDVLTHPGDSHSFHETKLVLAMPMTAPWGSMVAAVNKVLELKPKYVIPIHDWHWRPDMLEATYQMYKPQFEARGVELLLPVSGQPFQVQII